MTARLAKYVLRTLLFAEGVGAFVLWSIGLFDWGLTAAVGVACLVAMWCTFPEPHTAGAPSERVRVYRERKRNAPQPAPVVRLTFYPQCSCTPSAFRAEYHRGLKCYRCGGVM